MGSTITTEVELDLEDYAEEIEEYFCDNNCIKKDMIEKIEQFELIKEYINQLDKDLNVYLRPSDRDLKTVCYDLVRLVKG